MNNQLYHRDFRYNYLGAVVLLIILNKEILREVVKTDILRSGR